jgi:hypothetical protein
MTDPTERKSKAVNDFEKLINAYNNQQENVKQNSSQSVGGFINMPKSNSAMGRVDFGNQVKSHGDSPQIKPYIPPRQATQFQPQYTQPYIPPFNAQHATAQPMPQYMPAPIAQQMYVRPSQDMYMPYRQPTIMQNTYIPKATYIEQAPPIMKDKGTINIAIEDCNVSTTTATNTASSASSSSIQQSPAGPQGPRGYPGPAGQRGPTGSTGPAGRDGQNGSTGPTGSAGQMGPTGPAGRDGQHGLMGPTGSAGKDGANGNQGPQGSAGKDGQRGPPGQNGVAGATGPTGPMGPAGKDIDISTIPLNSILFKGDKNEAKGSLIFTYNEQQKTVNINGKLTVLNTIDADSIIIKTQTTQPVQVENETSKMLWCDKNSNVYIGTKQINTVSTSDNGFIGQVIQRRTAPSEKWLPLNGCTVSRALYSDLWNYVSKEVIAVLKSTEAIVIPEHGLDVGDAIKFSWMSHGITANTIYFVKSVIDKNSFTIAQTIHGPTLNITNDGRNLGRAILDVAYGFGDGTTTFTVEDARGVFYRGAGENTVLMKANGKPYNGGIYGLVFHDKMQGHLHGTGLNEFGYYMQSIGGSYAPMKGSSDTMSGMPPQTTPPITDGKNGQPRIGSETVPVHRATNYWVRAAL